MQSGIIYFGVAGLSAAPEEQARTPGVRVLQSWLMRAIQRHPQCRKSFRLHAPHRTHRPALHHARRQSRVDS